MRGPFEFDKLGSGPIFVPTVRDGEAYLVEEKKIKTSPSARRRATAIKGFRCKNLIAVIEDPKDIVNIGSVIRNANALGVDRVYVVDPGKALPDEWQDMREQRALSGLSVSAIKWTFVKRFDSTEACLDHLEAQGFESVVTSPHVKGKVNAYLHEGDFTLQGKLAVWFGNETKGISELAVARSSMCVAVPMFGMVESLNLGTCSGIVLYEVTKQRRAYQSLYAKKGQRGKRDEPFPTIMPRESDDAAQ